MIAATEFKCYSESNNGNYDNLIGRCIIFEGTEMSEYQYLFETLILGKDLGKNPYGFNINKYNGIQEGGTESTDKYLISNEAYILTDIGQEKPYQVFVGLHYLEEKGEYYLLRVPYGTLRVASESIDITFRSSSNKVISLKEDSYVLIMRNNQETELEFGSGTITTRSYLIANNPKELSKLSYLANGSKFPLKAPLYYQEQINSNFSINIDKKLRKVLKTPTNEGIRIISSHSESWNELNKSYIKRDIVIVGHWVLECKVDYTQSTNFNDSNIWKVIYDTNRRN